MKQLTTKHLLAWMPCHVRQRVLSEIGRLDGVEAKKVHAEASKAINELNREAARKLERIGIR